MILLIFVGVECPTGYSTLGHLSSGTSCYDVLPDKAPVSPDMCFVADTDELRHPASPDSKYFTEQMLAQMEGESAWLGVSMDMRGNWTELDLNGEVRGDINVVTAIADLTDRVTWTTAGDIDDDNNNTGKKNTFHFLSFFLSET